MTKNEKYLIRQIKSIQKIAACVSEKPNDLFELNVLLIAIKLLKHDNKSPIYIDSISLSELE